jgi:hypothetical protein
VATHAATQTAIVLYQASEISLILHDSWTPRDFKTKFSTNFLSSIWITCQTHNTAFEFVFVYFKCMLLPQDKSSIFTLLQNNW